MFGDNIFFGRSNNYVVNRELSNVSSSNHDVFIGTVIESVVPMIVYTVVCVF